MPHIRTKAPNGDRIVIVPEADYDRMIEAAEDLRDIEIGEAADSRNRERRFGIPDLCRGG
jgi:PHD/YefM family antitoxin component YafN of YafNO toxin-antitoxin module